MDEDTKKIPGNNYGSSKVAFGGTTDVGGGRTRKRGTSDRRIENRQRTGLEKRERKCLQSKAGTDFCPETCIVGACIHTKCIKCSKKNENNCPTMVEREGKLNEELINICLWFGQCH